MSSQLSPASFLVRIANIRKKELLEGVSLSIMSLDTHLQTSINNEQTIEAKKTYERVTTSHGVTLKRFHADYLEMRLKILLINQLAIVELVHTTKMVLLKEALEPLHWRQELICDMLKENGQRPSAQSCGHLRGKILNERITVFILIIMAWL